MMRERAGDDEQDQLTPRATRQVGGIAKGLHPFHGWTCDVLVVKGTYQ
jgi:hypothetical protein